MLLLLGTVFDPKVRCAEVLPEEPPVETSTAGNADDPLDKIIDAPSKLHVSGGYAAHPALLKHFKERTHIYTGGRYHEEPIRYRLLEPEKLELGKKYPLVVSFHGVGESDDDNVRQLAHVHFIMDHITGPKKSDFYMLVTQCPKDNTGWFSSLSPEGKGDAPKTITNEIFQHLLETCPVDRDRVSVMGLSSGGHAAWEFAAEHSDVFCALAPISANAPQNLSTVAKLKGVSIWMFNCSGDPGIDIEQLRQTVKKLKPAGYKIHLTEYDSRTHDAWTMALRYDDAVGWLLSQRKNDWRSPLPGRTFGWKTWLADVSPFAIPAVLIAISLVVWRDRRLRRKQINQLRESAEIVCEEIQETNFSKGAYEMTPERKEGFTLIELLVVIAVIALLISLLIPAVQAAREMARRAQCGNNMKQISLGITVYHESLKTFPPGNIVHDALFETACHVEGEEPTTAYCGSIGWPAFILPYVEQTALYDKVDFDTYAYVPVAGDYLTFHGASESAGDEKNKYVAENMPGLFVCPSAMRTAPPGTHKDYAANGARDCPERVFNHPEGVLYRNSGTKISDIKDGTTNTFLLLECIHSGWWKESPAPNKRVVYGANPFFWVNHASQGYVVYDDGFKGGDSAYPCNAKEEARWPYRGSRSDHNAGINVTMCDGSVHFISEKIAFDVYKGLFTRSGSEDVRVP